jgi:hypothetical protein
MSELKEGGFNTPMDTGIYAVSSNKHTAEATLGVNRRATPLDLLMLRAQGIYEDVREELERADQDDNDYCFLLTDFADAIDYFVCEAERLRQAPGVRMP